QGQREAYMSLLVNHFNPTTVPGLMCRSLLSVGWDGTLYDCDFNQMLELPLGAGVRTIWELDSIDALATRPIATGSHCFGCTAGAGSSVGPAAAFPLGRTPARDAIAARIGTSPRFAAIDRAVGREGLRIVLLVRLSPVFPFNLLNYAFGLTRVTLRDYLIGSLVGMLPGTVMYVYLGSLVTSFTELAAGRPSGGALQQAFYFGGLVATVAVTLYVTRVARRALA